ncbi:hypothetical protein HPP92_008478 [Vanilla planifolia]|uniref:Uncharacterized protein n=1 Tax=Vanilla planifolia TaxID=51239 RepID=A0A835R4S8_VANPL|nr:hypothetical protein HPP92_008478 [Vanilla planifolia]
MTLEVKEAALYVRKFLLFAIKSIYSSAASHPFVSSFALSLLLLYSCFPSLLFFLFSCFPVLLCTALLLGALLCYGDAVGPDIEVHDKLIGGVSSLNVERSVGDLSKLDADVDRKIEIEEKNSAPDARSEGCDACLASSSLIVEPIIPDIEDDDKINGGVLSLKLERSVDNLLIKTDDLSELDAYVDRRVENEESVKDAAPDARSESYDAFLASSSLIEETNKIGGQNVLYHSFEEHRESLMIEQPEVQINKPDKSGGEYVLYQGFHKNRQNFMKESDAQVRIHGVSIGVSEQIESLKVNINKPELDDWIDSPLSSPWQPINIRNAASDSESDHSESSSPDASMSDILPMLDELHPLLHSEATHHALQSTDNSDVELSPHQESDDDSLEQQDEHQLSEKDDSSMVVTWTADDQRNVMDLGSSDLERNRRLESLMARRRARKNQVIIFEKDQIELHSNDKAMNELSFHHQISPISAPRRNPLTSLINGRTPWALVQLLLFC